MRRRSIFLLKMLGVAALYALLIHMDHHYFESGNTVSSFETASGFALAMLLIGGKRYVWGVFLGAILMHTMTVTFWESVAISSGDALEAFCGAWLLTRDNKFDLSIRSLRDYLRLIFEGGVIAIGIGASFGVALLLVFGFVSPGNLFHDLAHWWVGDMLGIILIAPLILVCRHTKNDWLGAKRVAETALLLGLTFLAGQIVFLGWFTPNGPFELMAKDYWMFLFVALVAFRLGTRGTVIAINMTAVQALMGAYQGTGFFADDIAQTQLASYWCYTVILSVVGMALATYFTEQRNSEERLRQSEGKLRAYLDNISDTIWLIDADMNIAYVSSTVMHLLGVLPEELVGRSSVQVIHPDDMGIITNAMRYVTGSPGEPLTIQYRVSHKDGRWVHVESTGINMQGNPAINGVLVTMRDITNRRQAEKTLHRSETRLRTLYDSTSDAVMLLDENGFFDCNKATLAIFGCATREEFCTKHPADLSLPKQPCSTDSMTLANQMIATAMEKGGHQFEWIYQRADSGKVFPADVLLNRMELDGRKVLQATVRDITGRKRAEDTLRKLSLAVEQSPSSIVITDIDANIEYVNQAFVKETGYSPDEAIGQNPSLLNSGKNSKATYDEMWACLIRGEVWKGELINRRKDGSEYIESALISPVKQADGQITHYLAIKENVTKRNNNEAQIERLSRAYRLLSRVNEAIVRSRDRDELFAAICNAAIESELFRFVWIGMLDETWVIPVAHAGADVGYLSGKFNILLDDERTGNGPTGRSIREGAHVVCQDIEHDQDMAPWRDEAIKHGHRASAAFPISEVGGDAGAINVYAAEKHFFTPDIIQLMLELAADVSFSLDVFAEKKRRKLAEDEIKRINVELEHRVLERTRQLEAANKELEAFSYSVSHDLRTPLRSIDGFSRVLSKNYYAQLDATGKDWLERVCRASQHMGHLIDDMLQLSQVTRSPLKREPVDLSKIAESVADDLRKAYPERQVRFVLQQGLIIHADPSLMRAVMDNLLGNAHKYTGKKAEAEIEFGVKDINEEHTFFVRDNGAGFNMDYAYKLFGAFQRLHGTNEFDGTGIGLATVQRIIHRHYGKVWAEATEGQGATFYFTLPQKMQDI